ncbi:MAG: pyrroline-5-carboxylate reductase family protein, partial [Pirellulales bacterium]
MPQVRFGFIGAGRMATALARGFIETGLAKPQEMLASDPSAAQAKEFAAACGVQAVADNLAVAGVAGTLLLAVKPQHMGALLGELRPAVAGKLVVSIAAGVTLDCLQNGLGDGARLVRVMPNTPCLVCQGASAYCLGKTATDADASLVQSMLSAVGQAHLVTESLLDAVTGLSGSG